MIIPPLDPPPYYERLRLFFLATFFYIIIGVAWYAVKQILLNFGLNFIKTTQKKDGQNLKYKGERVEADGQIKKKIYEILSKEWTQNMFWGFLDPNK